MRKWIHFSTHDLSKLNQGDIENLNRPIISNEFEAVIELSNYENPMIVWIHC
jgi:hypothetical protein